MYIAIEGTKGTGKSTLIDGLQNMLLQQGIEYQMFAPTKAMSNDIWWEKAYSDFAKDDAFLDAMYTARANFHAGKVDFEAGLVIGDRSILTSCVSRWPHDDKAQLQAYIQSIRDKEFKVPVPDLVIYLDLDLDVTLSRLAKRERHYGLHDEQEFRLRQAKSAYQNIFDNKDELGFYQMQYEIINANQDPQQLQHKIYEVVIGYVEKSYKF